MAFRDILILTQRNIYDVLFPSHCLNEAHPAIKTSREEVNTMNLDTGISEIAKAILAFPTAAMLLVAFWLYVVRDRRTWW
jgi:hypothetical protein